ncbi:MAG TPA: phenylalanine--tRNA ligase beta subunit-related protein [Polyangiaceae bacterium]|nr:phenylalanine--tRNA ligase beta subunit-related protein [Polyangiaceae bacterium]
MLLVHPHPLLALGAIQVEYSSPLSEQPDLAWLSELLKPGAATPLAPVTDRLRSSVRDLLRHGGYKPTGRGKPASEYLVRAADEGSLKPINPAVDVGNVASLHSGFPISVIDLDKTVTLDTAGAELEIKIATAGDQYVFNASGQSIDLEGLLCAFDGQGPCANGVKDSQRTKTSAMTTRLLLLVWGVRADEERLRATVKFATELFERSGARVTPAELLGGANS